MQTNDAAVECDILHIIAQRQHVRAEMVSATAVGPEVIRFAVRV